MTKTFDAARSPEVSDWPADARVAVYYAPDPGDPLWPAGSAWLGWDAITGTVLRQPNIPALGAVTENARGYGFHATLKAPILLAPEVRWRDLQARARALCRRIAPVPLPRLQIGERRGFLALVETEPSAALHDLADHVVASLDDLRRPASTREIERRQAARLSPAQEAMLRRWGYPDVFDTWKFHMTLSRELDPPTLARLTKAATRFFAEACAMDRRVDSLCLFVQPGAGQNFTLAERLSLTGS